jgi:hypothetical protein
MVSVPAELIWPMRPVAFREAAPGFDEYRSVARKAISSTNSSIRPRQWVDGKDNQILIAWWDMYAPNGPYYGGPASIFQLLLPRSMHDAVRKDCVEVGAPMLATWLAEGKAAGEGWLMVRHTAEWWWPSGELVLDDH